MGSIDLNKAKRHDVFLTRNGLTAIFMGKERKSKKKAYTFYIPPVFYVYSFPDGRCCEDKDCGLDLIRLVHLGEINLCKAKIGDRFRTRCGLTAVYTGFDEFEEIDKVEHHCRIQEFGEKLYETNGLTPYSNYDNDFDLVERLK